MAGLAALGVATAAPAQHSPFAPAIIVNDQTITWFDLEQRERFVDALGTPGDVAKEAEKGLVQDALRIQAARDLGIEIDDETLKAGMEEFAGRANLSLDEFLAELEKVGVYPETFRHFVRAGLLWREVVRARFAPRARVTDDEVDRALSMAGRGRGVRVLLSEIILPLQPGREAEIEAFAKDLRAAITSPAAFAEAARRYSAASTAISGGKLDWLPLANLPPALVPTLLTMDNGDVTDPIPLGNAIGLFLMRGLDEGPAVPPPAQAIEFAVVPLSGKTPAAEAFAALRNQVDTCDDLYGVFKGRPEAFVRRSVLSGAVPGDLVTPLAALDPGEATLVPAAAGRPARFVMLCGRTPKIADGDRQAVREALFNRRLAAYADGYLAELEADAIIVRK